MTPTVQISRDNYFIIGNTVFVGPGFIDMGKGRYRFDIIADKNIFDFSVQNNMWLPDTANEKLALSWMVSRNKSDNLLQSGHLLS